MVIYSVVFSRCIKYVSGRRLDGTYPILVLIRHPRGLGSFTRLPKTSKGDSHQVLAPSIWTRNLSPLCVMEGKCRGCTQSRHPRWVDSLCEGTNTGMNLFYFLCDPQTSTLKVTSESSHYLLDRTMSRSRTNQNPTMNYSGRLEITELQSNKNNGKSI